MNLFEVFVGGPKLILFKQLQSFNAFKLFLHELEFGRCNVSYKTTLASV